MDSSVSVFRANNKLKCFIHLASRVWLIVHKKTQYVLDYLYIKQYVLMYPFPTVILYLQQYWGMKNVCGFFIHLLCQPCWFLAIANRCRNRITLNNLIHAKRQGTGTKWFTYIMSRHPSKSVSFSECYPQSLDIQIRVPSIYLVQCYI